MIYTFTLFSKFLILQFQTMVGVSFKTNAIESSFKLKVFKNWDQKLRRKNIKKIVWMEILTASAWQGSRDVAFLVNELSFPLFEGTHVRRTVAS